MKNLFLVAALGVLVVLVTLGTVFGAALILGELTVRVLGLNESAEEAGTY